MDWQVRAECLCRLFNGPFDGAGVHGDWGKVTSHIVKSFPHWHPRPLTFFRLH